MQRGCLPAGAVRDALDQLHDSIGRTVLWLPSQKLVRPLAVHQRNSQCQVDPATIRGRETVRVSFVLAESKRDGAIASRRNAPRADTGALGF